MLRALLRSEPRAPVQGQVHFHVDDSLHAILDRIALKWRCSPDIAARRVLVLALTGWKLRFAQLLVSLSRHVRDPSDPLRRTCGLLRQQFDGARLDDEDLEASLAVLLEELREREVAGRIADLPTLLAENAR